MALPVANNKEGLRYVKRLISKHKALCILTFSFQLLAAALAGILPWLAGKILDLIAQTNSFVLLKPYLLAIVLIFVVQIMVAYCAEYAAGIFGERSSQHMREEAMHKLLQLSILNVEQAGSGDLLGRISYDIRMVQGFFAQGFTSIVQVVLSLSVSYVMVFIAAPSLAWLLWLSLPALLILSKWYFKRVTPLIQAGSALVAQSAGQVSENASNASLIEAFGLQHKRIAKLDALMLSMWSQQYGVYETRARGFSCMNMIMLMPLFFAVLLGAYFVPAGLISLGALSSFTMYTLQLRAPITSAMFFITNAQVAWASLLRVSGFDLVKAQEAGTIKELDHADIELKDLSFSYAPHMPAVLHNINMTIKEGECIAVVGTTGAGKTSLARILAGIDRSYEGSACFGGHEIKDYDEQFLREQIIMLSQEHHVFSASLRDNLVLARPLSQAEPGGAQTASPDPMGDKPAGAQTASPNPACDKPAGAQTESAELLSAKSAVPDDSELIAALDLVGATWFYELEEGLDTILGSAGLQLSSAQAQELALARLALKDPKLIILDEATSMMDPSSAFKLERALGTLLKGKTVIMIAHRLFTAQQADRICLMDHGRIREMGSHAELLSAQGAYAKLWSAWNSDDLTDSK